MADKDFLRGKKILIVDDDPDVLKTLEEFLPSCETVRATTYEEAEHLFENQSFDLAILDIMGVEGFRLLDISVEKKVIAVMLTAHALSPENTLKSYNEGAALYVPKDKIAEIATYLLDVLEAKEKGKNFWWRWFERFSEYYEKKFGPEWQVARQAFWKRIEEEKHNALMKYYGL